MEQVITGIIPRAMFFLPPGSAKALALNTLVPTPDGWKLMGELRVGDQIFGDDGEPCNVTWVSPVWRDRPCYAVRTDCGDEIIADHDHEWLVRLCGKPRKPLKVDRDNRGLHGMMNRDDPMSQFKIKETHELCRRRAKRPMILRARPLVLPEVDLPIDPYLLGVWLGDGHSNGMRITSGAEDQVWLRGELHRLGYNTSDLSVPTSFGVLGIRGGFVRLGLVNDPVHNTHGRKHIPAEYMRASIDQRKSLLQGLIDTDGTVCKRSGSATFSNTNHELAIQVRELVRSLGVKAGWSEGRATLNGVDHGPCYGVSFYMKEAARLPRKARLCRDQHRTPNTYIDVVPAGRFDTVCIEVDSPSHLFLCGESMTPTHNSTYGSVVAPTWAMGRFPGTRVILASYGSDLARKHGRRARQIARSERYKSIFSTNISVDTSAADEWALTNTSEYLACGILSGITGNRAHGIIIDDPIKGRQEADSETVRQRSWDVYQEDLRTRLVPGGWEILIQTRWHEDDLAGRLLPKAYNGESGIIHCNDGRDWYVVCIPAECERNDDPLGRQPGEYLWPQWFSEEHFKPFKAVARTWSALFQQRPQPEQGTYFKKEWFKRYHPEELPKALFYYGSSDYAVTPDEAVTIKDEENSTEHGILGLDHLGDVWVMDWWTGKSEADVWIDAQIDLADTWKPFAWFGEKGVIRRAIAPFLRTRMRERNIYFRDEWIAVVASKAIRARAFQGRASQGKVHLPYGPIGDRIIDQCVRFPTTKIDDCVDVMSLFFLALEEAHPAILEVVPEILRKTLAQARIEHIEKPAPKDRIEEELLKDRGVMDKYFTRGEGAEREIYYDVE